MYSKNKSGKSKEKDSWMPSDLIYAVKNGDFERVKSILDNSPASIEDKNEYNQNALQVGLISLHFQISEYLFDNYDISVRDQDDFDRDALDLAIMVAPEGLLSKINDRWYDEPNPNGIEPVAYLM